MMQVHNGRSRLRGQVMTEFLLVASVTALFYVILSIFLNSYLEHQYRALNLLSSQYP